MRARMAVKAEPQEASAKAAPPKPVDVAREVWPGAWTADPQDEGALSLVLADPISLISAEIEAVFRAPYWHVRLNNRNQWMFLVQCSDLTEALTIARNKMCRTVADLAKNIR